MKKGLIVVITVVLLLALAVPAALALTDSQIGELESLYRQQHQIRLQILEKQEDFGIIDAQRAEIMRNRMEERWQWHQDRLAEGDFSFGFGRRGGFGRGCHY